jgi:beta-N-acetylhexosaminidase
LLVSDDLSMSALEGPLNARTKAALFAGCDIALHCNGRLDEMKQVASEAKPLAGDALRRAEKALAQLRDPAEFDAEAAEARLRDMLAGAVA